MSDLSPDHLLLVGYHSWPVERQVAYEATLKDLGYVIGPPRLERVGTYDHDLGYATTESERFSQ